VRKQSEGCGVKRLVHPGMLVSGLTTMIMALNPGNKQTITLIYIIMSVFAKYILDLSDIEDVFANCPSKIILYKNVSLV